MAAAASALSVEDPELYAIIKKEEKRQRGSLELIASENFTSLAVLECLGSCLTNKYSEGLPGARYYGGNEHIDEIEILCQKRALAAFGLSAEEWSVNVQPYSGSPANLAVYNALLKPHDRIMGLHLPDGGHLTHGFTTVLKDRTVKRVSAASQYYESMGYMVSDETGLIDYDKLAEQAASFLPRLIICGYSAYPRDLDYARFRAIADSVGAYLMCDMAHFSGFVATGELASPFPYCDVVTTTTHKTLRGPRAGMIFCKLALKAQIDTAVFPTLQGGPHNNTIAAIAVQLKEVATPAFKTYIRQVRANSQALAKFLMDNGQKLATNGTDNHLLLWDLRPHDVTGKKMEVACEEVLISVNKNTIHGDRNAISPGAVRLGTPALTTRGFLEPDMARVGAFLLRVLDLAKDVQSKSGKPLEKFTPAFKADPRVAALREEVFTFANQFPIPL